MISSATDAPVYQLYLSPMVKVVADSGLEFCAKLGFGGWLLQLSCTDVGNEQEIMVFSGAVGQSQEAPILPIIRGSPGHKARSTGAGYQVSQMGEMFAGGVEKRPSSAQG